MFYDTREEQYVAVHDVRGRHQVRFAALDRDMHGDYETHLGPFSRSEDDDPGWVNWTAEGGRFIPK